MFLDVDEAEGGGVGKPPASVEGLGVESTEVETPLEGGGLAGVEATMELRDSPEGPSATGHTSSSSSSPADH